MSVIQVYLSTDAERPAKAAWHQDAGVRVPLRGRGGPEESGGEGGTEHIPGGGQLGRDHWGPERARD